MIVRVIQTDTEEQFDFVLPDDYAEMLDLLIDRIPNLKETRFGEFANVGPAIEIRRVPENHSFKGRTDQRVRYQTWNLIRELVEGLDRTNGMGEKETGMRLLKLVEEVGEVGAAYIGSTGQNPRKGFTHTNADVASELCDVILTAAVALHRFTDKPEYTLNEHVRTVAQRARTSYGPKTE